MNTNVKSICETVEDIKENLTDYQYKTIMDNLMDINNDKPKQDDIQKQDAILEQVCFLYQYIPSIDDDNTKKVFVNRLELLNSNMLKLFR